MLLKGMTAGVVNIVRSFLSLFTGRRRKGVSAREAASDAATAAHDEGTADQAAAALGMAILTGDVTRVADAAAFSADLTATAADAAAVAADAAVTAANMAAITIDATAIAAEAAATADAATGDKAATSTDAARLAADAAAVSADAAEAAAASASAGTAPATSPASADAAAPAAAVIPATAPAAGPARPAKPQGRKVMSSGFDMQAEIAKLAERIIEPVAAKLTAQEREQVVHQIRDAFERLHRAAPDRSFDSIAAGILEPVRPNLTDAERKRGVDRLSGAMAAFCQGIGQRAA